MAKIEIDYEGLARRRAWDRLPPSMRGQRVPRSPESVLKIVERVAWAVLVVTVVLEVWLLVLR